MAALYRTSGKWIGALVFAVMQTQLASAAQPPAAGAAPGPDYNQILVRLQRLERDMRDVESVTFRKPPTDKSNLPNPPSDSDVANPPAADTPVVDLNPLMRRIDELEEGLGRLTGQMEQLGHQVDQLTEKADRLQKQLDFQSASQAKAEAAATAAMPADTAAPPTPQNQIASVDKPGSLQAPGAPPGLLGTIPANTPLPKPQDAADPRRQFDAAMGLLSRAKYDEASDAFRAYADAHPNEDRASDALYWTGDIAYSTKKDYAAAARDFAELLKKYPKAQRAPDGMLKLGLALFEMGQTREACAAVAALPAKYPDAAPAILTRAKSVRDDKKCR